MAGPERASGLPEDFSNKQEGCKAVLRFNQGGSQTLPPFSLIPSHISQRGQLAVRIPGLRGGLQSLGVLLAFPYPLSFHIKQIRGARKSYHSLSYLVALNLHVSSFLTWMRTLAGYCSQGTTWTGQVGTSHISQTGKILLMCIPPFPGILDKYFSKAGNLAEEALPIIQTTKKTWAIVCLIERNLSV